jgi:transposase
LNQSHASHALRLFAVQQGKRWPSEEGHDVKLISAQFVRPFVKSNKNDFLDAEAIAKAVDRQNMRFVPIKTDDQPDLQALHRVRDRLITRRRSVINQLRGCCETACVLAVFVGGEGFFLDVSVLG